jgi:phosphoadenosine phosphosulfate reductase
MTTLTLTRPGSESVEELADHLNDHSAQEIIAEAVEHFGGRLAVSCSFGGASGMVLVDLALKADPNVSVVYVDTDFLFPETYATVKAVEQRYGIRALGFRSALSVAAQDKLYGPTLWESDPDLCCSIRKVEPMRAALSNFDAYLTGLRRDQAETRRETPIAQWDAKFGLVKINPLANWTEKEVWSYIMANDLPYNPLHDQNYPSIGCTNCTRAVMPGEDLRAGRWSGTGKIECGLHVQ